MSTPYPASTFWPANFGGCTLHGTYVGLDGAVVAGSITLAASPPVLFDFTALKVILPRSLTISLDASGHFSLLVPATDDPDISPVGWTYTVTENFVGGRTYAIEAPLGGDVDIVTQSGVPDANGVPIVRGPRGLDGAVLTVQGLGIDGAANVDLSPKVALRANNLSDLASATTARTNLGLGSAATQPSTVFASVVDRDTTNAAVAVNAAAVAVNAPAITANAAAVAANTPAGTVLLWAGAAAPAGYFLADGAAVSRTTYAALFAVCGTAYGVGNGTTTFNLPNLKGRVAVGQDAAQSEFNVRGEVGGEKTHTLSAAELALHVHPITTGHGGALGDFRASDAGGSGTGVISATNAATDEQASGGQPHNNLQPYIAMNYIVKAF